MRTIAEDEPHNGRDGSSRRPAALPLHAPLPSYGLTPRAVGTWDLDLLSREGRLSPALQRLLGVNVQPGASALSPLLDTVHPEHAARVRTLLLSPEPSEEARQLEWPTDPARGPLRTLSATVHVLCDAQGTPVRSFGTVAELSGPRCEPCAFAELAALIAGATDAIVATDLAGRIRTWNGAAEELFGYGAAQMMGGTMARLLPAERAHEDDEMRTRVARGERAPSFTSVRVDARGRHIPVSITVSPIHDREGVVAGVSKIIRDMSTLAQHEAEIARLSRLYAALSQVNQAIVVTSDRSVLFAQVCRALVQQGGFRMAWIGWVDPESQRLVPVASHGDGDGYLDSIAVYVDERSEGRGLSGRAYREAKPQVCNDLLLEASAQPWHEQMEKRAFRASAAFPIRAAGEVRGVLSVYADEVGYFQGEELALLVEVAEDTSFALDNLERERARREAERQLRDERDLSNALLDALPGVFYLYDASLRFLRWNRNFERVTGRSAEQVAALSPLELFRGDDLARVADRIGHVFDEGSSSVVADLIDVSGGATPYFFTGARVELDGKRCLVGVGLDLSEQRRAEEERSRLEARYRALFEHAPDGICISSPDGVPIDVNPSLCRTLGMPRENIVGHSVRALCGADTAELTEATACLAPGEVFQTERLLRTADGREVPSELVTVLLPDGNVLHVVRDVTERRAAEAALRDLNDTLEQRVQQRTDELSAALVRAESADRLKSAFLATMSHELRTPLNSIIGFTGILLQRLAGPLNAEQEKQLSMVRGSGRHLLELINDVLDLSKIEADQLAVRFEPFELGPVFERAVGSVRPAAEKKGLSLTSELDPQLTSMESDRRRVEQILINLLNNAVKFTDRGGVVLRARLKLLDGVPWLEVQVVDTGVGIRPEDLGSLFLPFRQLDTGLARSHEGTGLGLAICRKLARLLGGEIHAASDFPHGSVFTVTLPLRKAA